MPNKSRLGFLWNPDNRSSANLKEMEILAAGLRFQVNP
jgi:hypothetical protein